MADDLELSSSEELDDVFETSDTEKDDVDTGGAQEAATTETTSIASIDDKGEQDAAPPAAEKEQTANEVPGKGHVPIAALHDERRRRQDAEKELEKYKNPDQKKQEEVPDVFVDPNAFAKHLKDETRAEILKTKAEMSQEFMRELKPDYDEKAARFIEMARVNPDLAGQMYASPNPAKFAYETAVAAINQESKLKLAEEIGDPVAYKEKLKAEILAELNLPASRKPKFENTPSLATAPAVRSETIKPLDNVNDMFDDDDL